MLNYFLASSVVSSRGPTNATKEHEKRILESILPPDLRHLVRGGSPGTIQVFQVILWLGRKNPIAVTFLTAVLGTLTNC
jgi:hypothetical protein